MRSRLATSTKDVHEPIFPTFNFQRENCECENCDTALNYSKKIKDLLSLNHLDISYERSLKIFLSSPWLSKPQFNDCSITISSQILVSRKTVIKADFQLTHRKNTIFHKSNIIKKSLSRLFHKKPAKSLCNWIFVIVVSSFYLISLLLSGKVLNHAVT